MAESPRIIELQQKFEDNPRRYFAGLANEYRKAGDFQRAISICRIYVESEPSHTAGHVVLGQALHATGKREEAEQSFKTVLQLDPDNLIALRCLGDIAQSRGDFVTAHDNFRKVLTADPRDHDSNRRLKEVEETLKLEAAGTADDWIPPRSDEHAVQEEPERQGDEAPAGPVSNAPALEYLETEPSETNEVLPEARSEVSPAQDDVGDEDSMDTLMPTSETDHHPMIAEAVELESAEDTLAVPDLLDEADIPVVTPAPMETEQHQYRTAEYSLPGYVEPEFDSGATATEMESEAEALMTDAEIPFAPPAAEKEIPGAPVRTGEYSLARDTAEWSRDSAETAAADDESAGEKSGLEPAGPFITETVAELYLQQGFTGEALLVYRQLARSKPRDQRIIDRIADLEQRLGQEHEARQAALDTTEAREPVVEPELERDRVEVTPASPAERTLDLDEFDRAWTPSAPEEEQDDWFATPDVAPLRARQTVHDFFAVLGRAKAGVRRTPVRVRVSADDIRNAADVAAGFGAFGVDPQHSAPKPISPTRGGADPQDDVRRFRAWLDGLSDS